MARLAQTVLPFKLKPTQEELTSNAGLVLFGEFLKGIGLSEWCLKELPKPGSGRGYLGSSYLWPLFLMLQGGGRSLEDLRVIKEDKGLARLLNLGQIPSTDAVGNWLRRNGQGLGFNSLGQIHQHILSTALRRCSRREHTLDCDATQIHAEKSAAKMTYKGMQGYMPILGHLAESGLIVHAEFREGNMSPSAENLEFIKACEAQLPEGHRVTQVRLDSAGYQADIFNYCEDTGKHFAIGGRLDGPTLKAIAGIPETAWRSYSDCSVAQTWHCMDKTKRYFRLIVVRYPHQRDLFEDHPRYHVIASNREESAEDTLVWYHQRGQTSENGIKELKIGFGMERMPCGQFEANAAFFRIGVMAHNLFQLFKQAVLDEEWQTHLVGTVRWRLFKRPGKVVRHAGGLILKVSSELFERFNRMRSLSFALSLSQPP